MLRLAECAGKWLLVKIGREYWYVLPNLEFGCVNSQDKDYGALDALEHMRKYGEPTYTRPTIRSC